MSFMTLASLIGAGALLYSAATAPGAPDVQNPPPPPNSVSYDEDGNVMSRQTAVFNKEGDPSSGIKEWVTYGPGAAPAKPAAAVAPGARPQEQSYMVNDTSGGDSTGPYVDTQAYNTAVSDWQAKGAAYDKSIADDATYQAELKTWTEKKAVRDAEAATQKAREETYWQDYEKSKVDAEAQKVQAEAAGTKYLGEYEAQKKTAEDAKIASDLQWGTTKEKAAAEAAIRAKERGSLAAYRDTLLGNLNKTPAERQAQYEAYQKTFSDAAHSDVDPRFAKFQRSNEEGMAAKGMFGSRAYADITSELATDKLKTDADIANQAVLAKETLATNDQNTWSNQLNAVNDAIKAGDITQAQIDDWIRNGELADQSTRAQIAANLTGASGQTSLNTSNTISNVNAVLADNKSSISNIMAQIKAGKDNTTALNANIMNNNAATANQNYNGLLGYTSALNTNALAKWQAASAKSSSYVSAGSNLAGGLMYLYGNKTGGKVSGSSQPSSNNGWSSSDMNRMSNDMFGPSS